MRGFFVFISTIFAFMKPHCRHSPIRAVAALLFFGVLASSAHAQSSDSRVDSTTVVVSMQDTLRPRPDRVQVWHSGSFLVSQATLDRVVRVPLESGRVPVSALGSASWDFSTGMIGRISAGSGSGFWRYAECFTNLLQAFLGRLPSAADDGRTCYRGSF